MLVASGLAGYGESSARRFGSDTRRERMHLRATARPSICQSATKALLGALLVLALSAAPALANAGKVLVFTGTAGTANPASPQIAAAITALGTANDFTVDSTG